MADCDIRHTDHASREELEQLLSELVQTTLSAMKDKPQTSQPVPDVVDATFTSVWDGGNTSISTECKVNLKTKEVFGIRLAGAEDSAGVDTLDKEEITLPDGSVHPVKPLHEAKWDESGFWYHD